MLIRNLDMFKRLILPKLKLWMQLAIALSCLDLVLALTPKRQTVIAKPVSQVQTLLPEDIQWEDNLNLAGIETAIALGNPGNAELYVLFNRISPGAVLPAHTHPDNRITTVISGTVYFGTGSELNPDSLEAYPAGSIIYTPAATPRLIMAKDEPTIIQHTGVGPTEIDFVE